jgi:hypothetical protein
MSTVGGSRRRSRWAPALVAVVVLAGVVATRETPSSPRHVDASPLLVRHVTLWRERLSVPHRRPADPRVRTVLQVLDPLIEAAETCRSAGCPALDPLLATLYVEGHALDEDGIDLLDHVRLGPVATDLLVGVLAPEGLHALGVDADPADPLHRQWASICDDDAGTSLQAIAALALLRAYAPSGGNPWRRVDPRAVEDGIRCL